MWHIYCAVSLRIDLRVSLAKPCAISDLSMKSMETHQVNVAYSLMSVYVMGMKTERKRDTKGRDYLRKRVRWCEKVLLFNY